MYQSMIPYGRQFIDNSDIEAVVDTLKSDFITQGPAVKQFEKAIAKKVKAKHAVAVSSATAALHLSCLALDLSENDTAWTVPLSFVASANAIKYCKATIDFVDICPDTGCICPEQLSKKLKQAEKLNKLPKLLIVVHFSGISCDMKTIASLCHPYNIKIVEDASHALGAYYHNEPVGSCLYSDLCVFSFHPVKIITSGEGGVITSNDTQLAQKLKLLGSHGITKDKDKLHDDAPPWYYEQKDLGFNYRMSDIHAALGLSQLSKLDNFIKIRNELAQNYLHELKDLPIEFITPPEGCLSSWHLFIIKVKKETKKTRKEIYLDLTKLNIGCQIHYIPIHWQPYYANLGFKKGDYLDSEKFYETCLSIPIYPSLTEQRYIVECLKKILCI